MKELEPKSDIHWRRDWGRIEGVAQQVLDIVHHFPPEVWDPLKNDLEIGYNATIRGVALLALDTEAVPGVEEVGEPDASSSDTIGEEEEYDKYEPQQFW